MRANLKETFRRFSTNASNMAGSIWAFVLALGVIVVWLVTGPVFRFSDTWQLLINTGTTIVTFLMVFLIQNTQNRDTRALHAKLDELIVHMVGADNKLVTAEDLSDEQLAELKSHFEKLGNGESSLKRQQRTKRAKAKVR